MASMLFKQFDIFFVGVLMLLQLLFAWIIFKCLDAMPTPPLGLSIVVGSQFLMIFVVGLKNRFSRERLLFYAVLLIILYVFALWLVFGPSSCLITARIEAVVSLVLLVGFALLNAILLVRLTRARSKKKRGITKCAGEN